MRTSVASVKCRGVKSSMMPPFILLLALLAAATQANAGCKKEKEDNQDVIECVFIEDFTAITTTLGASNNTVDVLKIFRSPQLALKREDLDILAFKKLKTLNLAENDLTTFDPEPFQTLAKLTYLHLGGNMLSLDDSSFSGLHSIERIRLSGNEMTSLDEAAFKQLKNLTDLNVSNNKLTSFPTTALQGIGLLYLHLGGNLLTSISEATFVGSDKLVGLDLSQNNIATIHRNAYQNLPALRHLILSNNKLTSLDGALFGNNALFSLDLTGNNMEHIGNFPLAIPSLRALRLANCNISTILPAYFNNVPKLTTLALDKNVIATIHPDLFTLLPNLVLLSLDDNKLKSLNVASFDQIYALLISPPKTLDTRDGLGEEFKWMVGLEPTVRMSSNPWNCSTSDMRELKTWCDQRQIAFDDVFTCTGQDRPIREMFNAQQ